MEAKSDAVLDRLFEVAYVLGELMNQRLSLAGLTPARAEVIWLLHQRGNQTQRELSQALKCTPRNVTGLVDALQREGFVARTPHPTDRRAVLVCLTPKGQTLVHSWQRDRDHGTTHLLGETSASDLATCAAVLERVLTNLRATYPTR
jgi:DNA-binding MarR family transcriptional regulator